MCPRCLSPHMDARVNKFGFITCFGVFLRTPRKQPKRPIRHPKILEKIQKSHFLFGRPCGQARRHSFKFEKSERREEETDLLG